MIDAGQGRYMGYVVRETAGAAATVRIRDGAGGTILDDLSLSAGQSTSDWFSMIGKGYATGLYLELVSGAVEGAVFVA